MNFSDKFTGPEIIIAGPGTGKTYTLIEKIKGLIIAHKKSKDGIIICTFTRKATEELIIRLYSDNEIKPQYLKNKELLIGTIHSISFHLLKEYLGDKYSEYEVLAEDEQINFIHSILLRLGFSEDEIKGRKGWQISEKLALVFNKITDEEIDITKINFQGNLELEEYCLMYPLYIRLLKRFKKFDYATIQKTLLDETNDLDTLSKIQNVFQFVFVDEYQDVNNLQDKLLKKIAARYNNITVVGDDDQSIYGFRGGNIEHILNFKSYFNDRSIKCKEQKLLINRRSTANIINTNKFLIENAKYKRLRKDIKPFRNIKGEKVFVIEFEDDIEEAKFITEQIKHLVENIKVVNYSDIAILFRSVKNHSEQIKQQLFNNNIPFNIIGAGDLFSTQMGEEFISLIDLYISKDKNRINVIYDRIEEIEHKYNSGILNDYVEYELLDKLDDFLASREKFKSCLGLVYGIFAVVDFIQRYKNELSNLGEITSIVKSYDEFSNYFDVFGLYSYISFLANNQKVSYSTEKNESVSLLTIHQAKGLEFPVVFLASQNERQQQKNLVDKFNELLNKKSDIAEERRIFYVGSTRAENLLYITYSKRLSNKKKAYKPLEFVTELKESGITASNVLNYKLSKGEFRIKNYDDNNRLFLSYNRISLYNKCPLHYYFQNVLNLQTVKIGGLIFGSNIHKIIEILLKQIIAGTYIEDIDINRILEEVWDEKSYNGSQESEKYKKAAYQQIFNLVSKYPNLFLKDKIYSVEETFNIKLDDAIITGRFDLCLKNNDKIEIIDFKTGDESDYTHQLSFYNYCFKYKNEIEPSNLYVYFLKTGRFEKINRIATDEVLKNINFVKNQIKQNIFYAQKGKHCKSCAYNKICDNYIS